MLLATLAVAVLPVVVVSAIQLTGALRSTLLAVAAAAALSLGASITGSALWTRRRGSRDVVFADLMIWGWVRRLRTERRLADVRELLGERAKLSPSRQAELLERLSAALEARDPYTHGHSRRVTRYSEAIARGMGLTRAQVAKVRTAAAVHDVGKIRTPRDVLNKPGRLTDDEFAAVKRHPVDGAELVACMGDPELTAMVRHHHERLDGRGYPDGLGAAEIPLGARIIAVADTFDAITSTRPYRAGGSHKLALDILRKEAGSQLDPAAVGAFLDYYSGRRSVAWWSVLISEPPRFVWWLLGWLQGAGATPIAKGVVAAGASALIGTTLTTPPAPDASIRSKAARAAVAQRTADRAGPSATPATRPEPAGPEEPGRPSGDRSRDGSRARSPERSRRSPPRPGKRSSRGGSRPVSVADDPGADPGSAGGGSSGAGGSNGGGGSGGGGDSGGGGPGGGGGSGDGGSGGGGSGGGDGPGGGGSGGGGSGPGPATGPDPVPLPTIEPPELPPLPADVPLPEKPELPPLPDMDSLPQVEPPPVRVEPAVLPSLEAG
jgi:putative nucleotidyltransferase with HDIG domain